MAIDWLTPLAALQAAISGVFSATVTSAGTGYQLPPTVTFGSPLSGGVLAKGTALMGVASIPVFRGGSGYTAPPYVIFDPANLGATATAQLGTFSVSGIIPGAAGTGYVSPPLVQFSGGGGSGAQATAILTGGQLVPPFNITSGGSGYTSAPTVTIVGSGNGATATATISTTGALDPTSLSITNAGSGYNYPASVVLLPSSTQTAPTMTPIMSGSGITGTTSLVCNGGYDSAAPPFVWISAPDQPGGTQAACNAILALNGAGPDYIITGFNFAAPGCTPGSGYTVPPTMRIDPPFYGGGFEQATCVALLSQHVVGVSFSGTGSGFSGTQSLTFSPPASGGGSGTTAAATCGVVSSVVSSIQLQQAGSGYAGQITVMITGGGGSGAQAVITAKPVGVTGYTLTAGGSGYASIPSVVIIGGGGSGATATATRGGSPVSGITVTNPGSGYGNTPLGVYVSGGGGSGCILSSALGVVGVDITAGGYAYESAPTIMFTSVDGNGSGAAATAVMAPALVNGDAFSIEEAITTANELLRVGTQYSAGIPVTVNTVASTFLSGPYINWSEMDKATRFAASVSPWFSWPTSWNMQPISDPNAIMTQRAMPLYIAMLAHIIGGGTLDPFFSEVWTPLFSTAQQAYAVYVNTQYEQTDSGATTPYQINDPIATQLLGLIAVAEELTAYLNTP